MKLTTATPQLTRTIIEQQQIIESIRHGFAA